jgi:phosphoribosylaminoimidazole-succinocarboxamide synthase
MPHIPGNVLTSPLIERVQHQLGQRARQGKVRAMFDLGEFLLMIATHRISAFDYVLSSLIGLKGDVLTALTAFWTLELENIQHHVVAYGRGIDKYIRKFGLDDYPELQRTGLLVRKYEPVMIECIVRGHLTGSGYKDYKKTGVVCGIKLPPGLRDGDPIPGGPIFSPSTKEVDGHDRNITMEEANRIAGPRVATRCKELSLEIFDQANEMLAPTGDLYADTKFEFGIDPLTGVVVLIDEILTPDSSRFWSEKQRATAVEQGQTPPSHDKQLVRDYLEGAGFKKMSQQERDEFQLPDPVRRQTTETYLDTFARIVGKPLGEFQREDMGVIA